MSTAIKIKVQNFGRFLSNMVMPNIAAFIAWGMITALFIPTGWVPNPLLAKLVQPMLTYMLPLLIGYTGGRLVSGQRGGVVGAITTLGVIVGTDIPMFLGAMITGPLGGLVIKLFDHAMVGRVKSGFEMLVNNFSAGIIGMLLALLALTSIGPLVEWVTHLLSLGVNAMLQHNLLPLTSIIVEPAKILFLNNAINHGIFSPLGFQQVTESGKSLFFLIEANPGPGLGILLAYQFFGQGSARQSAGGAAIIHFLGGIHEIYFPYVLMAPRLLFAVIIGGMSGVFTLMLLKGGLVSPASPGSIIAILALTPKGVWFANIAAIFAAFIASFAVAALLLSMQKIRNGQHFDSALERANTMKKLAKTGKASTEILLDFTNVRKIIVACDAGMGSSAMAASLLRKKLEQVGMKQIEVSNVAINNLVDDADLVITHRDLTARAKQRVPHIQHLSLSNFLDNEIYDALIKRLQNTKGVSPTLHQVEEVGILTQDANTGDLPLLSRASVFLNLQAENKEQVIRFIGEQLVNGGCVTPAYVDAMLVREQISSTYLGNEIAIPHGTVEAKDQILKTGIIFCQYPQGVQFGEEKEEIARLVIGIAARNDEHLAIISRLTNALDDEESIKKLITTTDVNDVLHLLA